MYDSLTQGSFGRANVPSIRTMVRSSASLGHPFIFCSTHTTSCTLNNKLRKSTQINVETDGRYKCGSNIETVDGEPGGTDEVTPPLAIGFKTGARSLRWGQDFRSYKAFSLACWPRDLSLTNSTKRYGSFSARYLETRYSISTHRRVWRQYGLCHPVVH